ncbi:MAG: hypothetical protein M1540_07485 [Candidatus Bathyarchaeota archaeon]|nr:hypothetical protein [Candidatus Bathyarchaeota archaeon]
MSNSEPKVEATKSSLLFGNLTAIVWIFLGTFGCWLINTLYGYLFLAFSAFSIYIIVRRLMCNSCYYCKSCTKGIAKLSILFLGANSIPGLSKGSILGMVVFVYVVLMIVPSSLLVNSLLQEFNLLNASVLAGILSISIFSIVVRIKKGRQTYHSLTSSVL